MTRKQAEKIVLECWKGNRHGHVHERMVRAIMKAYEDGRGPVPDHADDEKRAAQGS